MPGWIGGNVRPEQLAEVMSSAKAICGGEERMQRETRTTGRDDAQRTIGGDYGPRRLAIAIGLEPRQHHWWDKGNGEAEPTK